jgi:membrane protease YdiL (CAAX protease family)
MDLKPKPPGRIGTLVRVMLFCLFCAVIFAIYSRLTQSIQKSWSEDLKIVLAVVTSFGLTLLFLRWEGLNLADVGLMPGKQTIPRICIGFVIGLLIASLQALPVLLFGHIRLALYPHVNFQFIFSSFFLYSLLACREELVFRGYALRSLDYKLGNWPALLITGFIFALEHIAGGMTWSVAFLGAGTGSILFGLAALKTKGIALPIGLHAAWNFGQWALGFKHVPGIWEAIIEKGYEKQLDNIGLMSYLLVMVLAIPVFYYYKFNHSVSNSQNHA